MIEISWHIKLSWLGSVLLQFVIVSLSGWGLLIFGGYKFFTGGKGKKEEVLQISFSLKHYDIVVVGYEPRHQIS